MRTMAEKTSSMIAMQGRLKSFMQRRIKPIWARKFCAKPSVFRRCCRRPSWLVPDVALASSSASSGRAFRKWVRLKKKLRYSIPPACLCFQTGPPLWRGLPSPADALRSLEQSAARSLALPSRPQSTMKDSNFETSLSQSEGDVKSSISKKSLAGSTTRSPQTRCGPNETDAIAGPETIDRQPSNVRPVSFIKEGLPAFCPNNVNKTSQIHVFNYLQSACLHYKAACWQEKKYCQTKPDFIWP